MRILLMIFISIICAKAHFLTLLPSSDYVIDKKQSVVRLDAMFIHPFEQTGMTMEKPKGLFVNSVNHALEIKETKQFNHKTWQGQYKLKRPGVYQFFVQPEPYFEKSEAKYISHVPKVIISGFGIEDGWDKPIGLDYEIIPLVKPFGLYQGNLFQGQVLRHGKPVANVEVEVELYNEFGLKAPTDAHITQVIKADNNGIFSFVMNHKGWWGFAALIVEGEKVFDDGMMYPIENGALIWVKAY